MTEWRKFLEHINENIVEQKIEAKLSGDSLKIIPHSISDYRKLQEYLKNNNMEYHTVHLKEERPRKVIVRGLPYGQDPLEVAADLKEKGFQVLSAMPLRDRKKGYIMPLILISLKADNNWEQVYNVQHIFSCVVNIVPFNPPRIRQCYRCQRYGHSSNGCTMPARCVKCAGNHLAKECTLIKGKDKPKCALCGDPHPANYSKCSKHPDEIRRRKAEEKENLKNLAKNGKNGKNIQTNEGNSRYIDAPPPRIPAWQKYNEKIKEKPTQHLASVPLDQSDATQKEDFPLLPVPTPPKPRRVREMEKNNPAPTPIVQNRNELDENGDVSLAEIFPAIRNFCKVINVKGLVKILKSATNQIQTTTNKEDKVYILMDSIQSLFTLYDQP